jgi:hypothetical protein
MDRLDLQDVEQRPGIVGQLRDRVGAARAVGQAVAAHVVAQDAEPVGQGSHLRVPYVEIGTQRIREQEDRTARRAGQLVMHHQIAGPDVRHCPSLSF